MAAATEKRKVGSYEILETLGKGGYSWVKKGVDAKSKNFVALKFMARAEDAWAADQAEQVRTEIKSLTQVRHENVMKLYAYNLNSKYPDKSGKTISTILLVLEFCPGGELFDILYYTDKLDAKTARTYFRMMIAGIEACHKAGITHRDIKPQNLLLDKNYQLKLTDFGLSKINENPNETMSTTYVGTRGYQAPELINNKKYTKSCDIFSAGVVLFILLTGYPPFEQGSKKDKWYRPLYKQNPKKFWNQHDGCGIDDECKSLLEAMLTYKPKNRITIDNIKKTKWYTGDVWSKAELKQILRQRHKQSDQRRKADANKQREMVHSVKRNIPKEFLGFEDNKPETGTPGLFNVIRLNDKVNAFHALWRAKELLESEKCKCSVEWDKTKPFMFQANFNESDNKYSMRVHVRTDEDNGKTYLEFKRTKAEGLGAQIKFRQILDQFMIYINADDTFQLGFDEEGKAITSDAPAKKDAMEDEVKEEAAQGKAMCSIPGM